MLDSMQSAVVAYPYVVTAGGMVFAAFGTVEFEVARRRGNAASRWVLIALIGIALAALGIRHHQVIAAVRPAVDPAIHFGELDGPTAVVIATTATLTAVATILIPKARSAE